MTPMSPKSNTTGDVAKNIAEVQNIISQEFKNPELLTRALTHSSASNGALPNNERLEFLGDAIVGVSITDYLYRTYKELGEGTLTQIKSAIVSGDSLAEKTKRLNLAPYAHFGRGMPPHKQLSNSVLANIFEAVVGAIYLDAGFDVARDFVVSQLAADIEPMLENGLNNYKAELQERCLRNDSMLPKYRTIKSSGPDHRKIFCVEVRVGSRVFPSATGRSKKAAEQNAAANALAQLDKEGVDSDTK